MGVISSSNRIGATCEVETNRQQYQRMNKNMKNEAYFDRFCTCTVMTSNLAINVNDTCINKDKDSPVMTISDITNRTESSKLNSINNIVDSNHKLIRHRLNQRSFSRRNAWHE